jgi:hypothetical protein
MYDLDVTGNDIFAEGTAPPSQAVFDIQAALSKAVRKEFKKHDKKRTKKSKTWKWGDGKYYEYHGKKSKKKHHGKKRKKTQSDASHLLTKAADIAIGTGLPLIIESFFDSRQRRRRGGGWYE